MRCPGIPNDEKQRLASLRALEILDTAPEERFDRITRLAQRVFGVPIALVSLVDTKRQWFKSRVGLVATETPREISFCGHAIHEDGIFLVSDARKDPRFFDNPLVKNEPHIRFYAGCPLRYLDGSKLGTLCIIDSAPREFSEVDKTALRDLAGIAERELCATHLAALDDLTQLLNRRGFMAMSQASLSLCAKRGSAVTLAYFDLDGFKDINDRYGHEEGDRALVAFAEQMRAVFRNGDVIGRWGGDEFVGLLTDTDNSDARGVLARLQAAIDQTNATRRSGYKLTFSAGYASADADTEVRLEDLLRRADAMMYRSKQARGTASVC